MILEKVLKMAEENLVQYPTTIEEDENKLKDKDMPFKHKCSLL